MNGMFWQGFIGILGVALLLLIPITFPIWGRLLKSWMRGWFRS